MKKVQCSAKSPARPLQDHRAVALAALPDRRPDPEPVPMHPLRPMPSSA
jgi:hypothetical protein